MTQKRPPIVVVLGHVDHGKTTLLDYIRKTSVAGREAGGITQVIGACEIEHNGERITMIDTPGHEAFSIMRQCGAQFADLAILVVAADDGVKPQTKEALACIKKAKIPFVVAINKIDMPGANVLQTKNDLSQAEVYLEGMGGDVSWQAISAKTGEGVPELLDLLLLAASVQEFTFDPAAVAMGTIMTARLDHKRGIIVGAILQNGTLAQGQFVATKTAKGKIKILEDATGERVERLLPSAPSLIFGFNDLPQVGELFCAGEDEAKISATLKTLREKASLPKTAVVSLESLAEHALPLLLKADEAGSLTVLAHLVQKLSSPEHPFAVIQTGVGNVYENDIKMCESTGAVLVGFKIKADKAAQNLAQAKRITILSSSIIYELEEMLKKYAKRFVVRDFPVIELLKTFRVSDLKQQIVGGRVTRGPVKNQATFSIRRGDKAIGDGKMINLQSNRKDVPEAHEGQEVGLLVFASVGLKAGDKLEFE